MLPWLDPYARVSRRLADSVQKGHRYATVIVGPTRKRVLWIGRGRGREDVRPFFELLGPERCARLKAAVMDMNASCELAVRRHCPQAAIVLDLFHVVAKHGREVIDRVRVDRANELRAQRSERRIVKGAHCRYPLGTNLLEGINNRIKVIKRMACGFRDDACFFLRIR